MCHLWQPCVIPLWNIVSVSAFFLNHYCFENNLVGETSYLYGPLLYTAILDQLPLVFNESYSVLKYIVSFYSSVSLLNLELFGHIP